MTDTARDSAAASAVKLLTHYSFDLGESTTQQLVDWWLQAYPCQWIHLALIEALYQGRYKAVSVGQILAFWQRRGQPIYRFNREFERLICDRFPQKLSTPKNKELGALAVERERGRRSRQVRPARSVPPSPKRHKARPDPQGNSLPASLPAGLVTSTSVHKLAESSLAGMDELSMGETLAPAITPEHDHSSLSPAPAEPGRQAAAADNQRMLEGLPPIRSVTNRPKSEAESVYQAKWSGLRPYPIHQFVPHLELSDVYAKLTAIAEGKLKAMVAGHDRGSREHQA